MRVIATSFGAWRSLERQEQVHGRHTLTFSLAVVAAIGSPYGLELIAEEDVPDATGFDAVFASVLDTVNLFDSVAAFRRMRVPFLSSDRPIGKWPLVWMGGQGLANPVSVAQIADLIVVGDAEDPLPELLRLWDRHGNSRAFLECAASVPGVFVPSVHDRSCDVVVQSVSCDIGVTLRNDIRVTLNGGRRIEIARGCRSKCAFCTLGWRAPLRENSADEIISEISRSPKTLHLQAGDAESHRGIALIRDAMTAHGAIDDGWTGSVRSVGAAGTAVGAQKRFAFGVEGVSERLRRGVGKGHLTDDFLTNETVDFLDRIEGTGKGRSAWHLIAGLPTQRRFEEQLLFRLVNEIDSRRRGHVPRNLAIHWQPFTPQPGTPAQWCAVGHGARQMALAVRSLERNRWVCVRQQTGRTDEMARAAMTIARADERGADGLLAAANGARSDALSRVTGSGWGALDPDAPLPWDWIEYAYPRRVLRRAYDVMMGRLDAPPPIRTMDP